MNSESPICQICGKSKQPSSSSPGGHCQGHKPEWKQSSEDTIPPDDVSGAASKDELDAIPTPGFSRQPQPASDSSSPAGSLKDQLDAIPTPKSSEPGAAGGLSLKKSSDANPKLSSGLMNKGNNVSLKEQLDGIPTPGAGASQAGGASIADQLDSIPTPGSGSSRAENARAENARGHGGGASMTDQLDAIPTPGSGGPPDGQEPKGEVPQWMRNYAQHQSAITNTGSAPVQPDPYRAPASRPSGDLPQAAPGGYQLVIGLMIIICIVLFGYLSLNKPPAPTMPPGSSSAP